MKKYIGIILMALATLPLWGAPKQSEKSTLSVERQQQFTYYWYAAKQAIREERYPEAMVLLKFCEQLNPQDGETQGLLGVMYDALGDSKRAFDAFERAFRNDPYDQWYRYFAVLMAQKTAEGRSEALRVLEKAHQVNPKNEELLEQLRRLYVANAQCKKALAIQDEIDAIRGYDVYSAYNRTSTYAVWGKPKKAIAEVDKWLENEPTNVQFLLYRIELMERTGTRAKELYEMYERVLRIDPGNLMVMNNYAYLLATHKGDLRKAEQLSQIAIREEPENPVYLDTYGWIMHLQGQDQLALFYLEKALRNTTEAARAEIEAHLKKVKNER